MNIAELFVRLSADPSGLKRGMTEGQKSMDALKRAAGALGVALSAGALFRGIIRNSIEAQASLAQLEARVQSTGGAAGRSVAQLTAHAAALQSITTFGDEAIQTAQALLLTFKRIRGAEFDRATAATLDLATAMGGDLKGAALQLGKALEDPVRGLTALRRSGVSFTEAQQDVIKSLVESGKVAEAQNLILAEMETQFGGAAKAARNTLGGALQGLSNAWGDALEVSGQASSGIVGAINGIGKAIPFVRGAVDVFFQGIQRAGSLAAVAVEELRLGWLELKAMGTFGTGKNAILTEIGQTRDQIERLKVAADDMWTEMITGSAFVPPAIARINTELSGLEEPIATIGRSMSDWVAVGGMGMREVSTTISDMKLPVVDLTRATQGAAASMIQFGDAVASTTVRGIDDFAAFAIGAGGSFSDFVKGMMADLAKLMIRLAIVGALRAAAFGGAFGGGQFAHSILALTEKRASGGPVRGGKPYLVGERGPEMFVPSSSGSIVPNGGAAALQLPPLPRPMSPTEAASQAWFIEAIRIVTRNNEQRG